MSSVDRTLMEWMIWIPILRICRLLLGRMINPFLKELHNNVHSNKNKIHIINLFPPLNRINYK